MRTPVMLPALCLAFAALCACSSESDDADEAHTGKEHVWKDQVEAIDKAREVETILKRKQDRQQQQ